MTAPHPIVESIRLAMEHHPVRLSLEAAHVGRFDACDKGQMELYLRWPDRHERQPGENPPLGLILCADKRASGPRGLALCRAQKPSRL
jgi:hypothetical protein